MTPSSKFEILRYRKTRAQSGQFTSATLTNTPSTAVGTETAPRGLALGAHATNSEALDVAQSGKFMGFLTRRVAVGGLAPSDRFMMEATGLVGQASSAPIGLESPFVDGQEVTVRDAEEIECEGADYLYSGTGQITEVTAVGAQLSFKDGKLRVAQSGEVVYFTLSANDLTQFTDGAGNLRIRAQRI